MVRLYTLVPYISQQFAKAKFLVQISSQRPHSTPAALGISFEETMEEYSEDRSLMASKWAIKSSETEPQVFGNQAFGLPITYAGSV